MTLGSRPHLAAESDSYPNPDPKIIILSSCITPFPSDHKTLQKKGQYDYPHFIVWETSQEPGSNLLTIAQEASGKIGT